MDTDEELAGYLMKLSKCLAEQPNQPQELAILTAEALIEAYLGSSLTPIPRRFRMARQTAAKVVANKFNLPQDFREQGRECKGPHAINAALFKQGCDVAKKILNVRN